MIKLVASVCVDADAGLFVSFVPGHPGVHSQASSVKELKKNMVEVAELELETSEIDIVLASDDPLLQALINLWESFISSGGEASAQEP